MEVGVTRRVKRPHSAPLWMWSCHIRVWIFLDKRLLRMFLLFLLSCVDTVL